MTLAVYATAGGGDVIAEYFNAIAATFGMSSFGTLIKLAVTLSVVTLICSWIMKKDYMLMLKWFGTYYLAIFILFTPKTSIEVIDPLHGDAGISVANIPIGLAVLASYTSTVGYGLTLMLEQNFTEPDDMNYAQTGMVMASRLLTESSHFQITDPNFNNNMNDFVHQCVFYDLLLGKYDFTTLLTQQNLWGFLTTNASPARAFMYNGQVTTCQSGVQNLSQDWAKELDQAAGLYGARIFPKSQTPKEDLLKFLPLGYSYLTGLSQDASQIMQQDIMANAIDNGLIGMAASSNAPAALQSYAVVRANDQKRETYQTLGLMASYWLPIMNCAFQAILYGCFIFVLLLTIIGGVRYLVYYAYSLLWLQLWGPMYAIINLLMSFYAQKHSLAIVGSAGVTLQNMPGLLQVNQDIAAVAGYMTLSVPFILSGLVYGMHRTFTQLAQYMGGVTQSVGSAAAAEAVTGSMSFGNTNLNNSSMFNTSANHLDTSARMVSGAMSVQLQGGAMVSTMADGTRVMDTNQAMSNLGTSVNLADSVRATASQQAEVSYNAALSKASAYGQAMSDGIRQLYDYADQFGKSQSSGSSSSYSTNASINDSMNQVHQLTERFAHDHGITYRHASQLLASAYTSSSVSGDINSDKNILGKAVGAVTGAEAKWSVSGGGKVEKSGTWSTDHSELLNAAQSFANDTGYSHSMDVAVRAMQDHSFRTGTDASQRVVDSVGASLDQANTLRNDLTSSFQQSQSYRQVASMSQEDALNINSNMGQAFYEWMSKQPGTNGSGNLSQQDIAGMVAHPEMGAYYAKRFSEQYTQQIASHWNQGMPSSAGSVQGAYQQNNTAVPDAQSLNNTFATNKSSVDQRSSALGTNRTVDSSALTMASNVINQNNVAMDAEKRTINAKGGAIEGTVQDKNK